MLEDAFAREVFEETGLVISEIELLRVVSGYRMRLEVYFRSRLSADVSAHTIKIQKQEVLEARSFSLHELPENMLPAQREIVHLLWS